jgi:hypothetical protein
MERLLGMLNCHSAHLSFAGVQKTHHNLTSPYIANEMYGMLVENMSFEPKSIIRHIQESTSIPSRTARRGVQNRRC